MKFAPRHVVAIVASVCAAAVLTPVGVMAATGSLVNLTDPYDATRKARVGAAGALQVESRAGVPQNAYQYAVTATGLGHFVAAESTGPERLAITDISFASQGPVNGSTSGHNIVDVTSYVQTTGTSACGTTTTGYTRRVLRRFIVRNLEQTGQLRFDGPPLLIPSAPAGKKVCAVLEVSTYTSSSAVYLGVAGFRFH